MMMHLLLKTLFKEVSNSQKLMGEIAALSHVTFGKLLIIILAFRVFMGLTFSFWIFLLQQMYRGSEKILKRMLNGVH